MYLTHLVMNKYFIKLMQKRIRTCD